MTEPIKFSLPVTVDNVRMLKDRSVKVTVHSMEEVSDAVFYVIHRAFQRGGWVVFSEQPIQDGDVPDEQLPTEAKSQGQRIRAVLYRCWEQSKKEEDFETYYRRRTEKVINHFKQELD